MPAITPCLWFDTEAEAAAQLYTSVFPNSSITRTSRYGDAVPDRSGDVLTVEFVLDGTSFVALNGGPEFTFDEAVSFQVDCQTQDDVDHYWNKLSEGGEEGPCGWVKDRFGLSWQIEPTIMSQYLTDPDEAKSQRVMSAMMQMKKLDIAELTAAYEGS